MTSKGKDGCVVGQPVRRRRQGQRGCSFSYASLSSPLAVRPVRVLCLSLLRRGGALCFRGVPGLFSLTGQLGYEFKDSVFLVVLPCRGFAVS